MAVRSVDSVWCSVADMEAALGFYHGYAGLEVLADELWPDRMAGELFRLPAGTQTRVVTVDGGLRQTNLMLVEFKPGSARRIREGAKPWDIGFYCTTFLVQDLDKISRELEARGFSFVGDTARYSASFAPHGVSERTLVGPEGVAVNHFQRHSGGDYGTGRNYVQLDHCGVEVRSLAEAKRFFEAVGLHCILGDTEIPAGVVDHVIGLPPGHRIRQSVWGTKERTTVGLELLEITPQGRMAAGRPPDRGLFMIGLSVDALQPALSAAQGAGFRLFGGPQQAAGAYGARCAIVEGPSDILFLLQEKNGREGTSSRHG